MNEINTQYPSGNSLYAKIENTANLVYQTTTNSLVVFNNANWSTYLVPLTEQGTSGFYSASFPALPADSYSVLIYSGTGLETDPVVAGNSFDWDGAGETANALDSSTLLQIEATSGSTVYALLRNPANLIYQPTTQTLVAFADASFSTYQLDATEQGTSGFFSVPFPTALPSGTYTVGFFKGSGSESDTFIAGNDIFWNGVQTSPSATGLVSLGYVKDLIGPMVNATTIYDSYLINRINASSVAISNWCNKNFFLTNYVENYDGTDSTSLLLNNRPVQTVEQVTLNIYSTVPTVIPGSAIIINKGTGIISINPMSTYNGWFSYDYATAQQSHQVIYSAGYPTIPTDIQEVCAEMVRNQFLIRGQDVTMTSETIDDYSYTRRNDCAKLITNDMQAILFKYKDFVV